MENGKYLLMEVIEREISIPVRFFSYKQAYQEMRRRYAQATGIDLENPNSEEREQIERELRERSAHTEQHGQIFDWKLFYEMKFGRLSTKIPIPETFGTLYLEDGPQKNPKWPISGGDIPKYDEGPITIGDTVKDSDYAIHWVRLESMLVCDRNLLVNISRRDLEDKGFVSGVEVVIDGRKYLCRLLTHVGYEEEALGLDEWFVMMEEESENDDLWHWNGCCSWSGDEGVQLPNGKVVCETWGFDRAGRHRDGKNEESREYVGFRPVLIPID